MKRFFLLCSLCLSITIVQAQYANLRIVSGTGDSFWLYVNHILQNQAPASALGIQNLYPGLYDITLVMNNPGYPESTQSIQLREGDNSYIANIHSNYGQLSISLRRRHPITAMDRECPLMTEQPYEGYRHEPHQIPFDWQQPPTIPQQPIMPSMPPTQPAVNMPPTPHPCSPEDYNSILTSVKAQAFDDDRLKVAKQALSAQFLTVDQIVGIAKLFPFENSKIEFLKFAYFHCINREQYYRVNEALTYSSSKDEINEFLESQQNRR